MVRVSEEAFRRIEKEGYWGGIIGEPEIERAPSGHAFQHATVRLEGLEASDVKAVAPLAQGWLALTATGELVELDFAEKTVRPLASLAEALDLTLHLELRVSEDGCFVAAFEARGQKGVVWERESAQVLQTLNRNASDPEVCPFSFAFFSHQDRTLVVQATQWNRLDVTDPHTGELLTPRTLPTYQQGVHQEHYLDFFHGSLYPSPDGSWIADDGWVWHPIGVVTWWSLRRWLAENVWESEDSQETPTSPCWRDGFWGGPICWIDNTTLAVWGYGRDESWLAPGVRLFDVTTNRELGWFPGPQSSRKGCEFWEPETPFHNGWMVYDQALFVCSLEHGVSVWDVATGAWLLEDTSFFPAAYQQTTRTFLTLLPDGAFQLSTCVKTSPQPLSQAVASSLGKGLLYGERG